MPAVAGTENLPSAKALPGQRIPRRAVAIQSNPTSVVEAVERPPFDVARYLRLKKFYAAKRAGGYSGHLTDFKRLVLASDDDQTFNLAISKRLQKCVVVLEGHTSVRIAVRA
jgi:hypothetical protein